MKRAQKNGGHGCYRCALCNQTMLSLYSMKEHVLRHIKVTPDQYLQDYCSTTNGQREQNKKIKRKSDYLCPHCGYFTSWARQFKRHLVKHSYLKPYTCSFCGLLCLTSSDLKYHQKIHSNIRPFHCDKCSFSCKRAYHLKRHLITHSVKSFHCEVCQFASATKYGLKYHMYKHSGERPYRCRLCYYSFTQSTSLKIHLKNQHGELMYRCTQCGNSYDRKVEFISHQRTHVDSWIKLELGTWFRNCDSGAEDDDGMKTKQDLIPEKKTRKRKREKIEMKSRRQEAKKKDCRHKNIINPGAEELSGKKENAGKEHHEDAGDQHSIKEFSQESAELWCDVSRVKSEYQSGFDAELNQCGPHLNGNEKLENGPGLIFQIKDESTRNVRPNVTLPPDQSYCRYFNSEEVSLSQKGGTSLHIKDSLHERDISPSTGMGYEDEVGESCAWNSELENHFTMQIGESQGENSLNENQVSDSWTSVLSEEDRKAELRESSLNDGELKKEIFDSVMVKEEEEEPCYEICQSKKRRKTLLAQSEGQTKKCKCEKDQEAWKWNVAEASGWKKEKLESSATFKSETANSEGSFQQGRKTRTNLVPRTQAWQVNENVESFLRTEVHQKKSKNILRELKVNRYTCILCNVRLDRRKHMIRHTDNHARGIYLPCWLCPVICFCRSSLKKHERTHQGLDNCYHCSLCSFSHAKPKQLKIHSFSHRKIKAFYCNDCSYATHWQENLKRHILAHHTEVKTYLCSECGQSFYSKAMLMRHSLSHKERLVCQECGYCTHIRYMFKIHVLVHSQNRPFACDRCPFRTKRAWHLNRHKLIHETTKRYHCQHCSFTANQASAFKTHQYTHTGEFPFTCHLCDYSCRQSSCLKSHLKVRHQECLYRCELCDFETNRLLELRGHKLSHQELKL